MSRAQVGMVVPVQPWPAITQEQLKRYAEASGDDNPIHLDEKVALEMGLPGVIAHGMLSAAFIGERALRFAHDELGERGLRVRRIQTRFKAMTLLGDVITIGGTVKSVEGGLTLDLQARNQKGEITTTGVIEFA